MRPRLATALLALVALPAAFGQTGLEADAQGNANLQNLLASLTRGTTVTMYTPLPYGLIQVTRFQPPLPLGRPEAEAAVAIAREHLRLLDITHPTADQFAKALAGGTIEMRDGPTTLPSVLPTTGGPAVVTSEVVLASGLPQVAPPNSAAAGGSAPVPPATPTTRISP
jgi:hypothetical protein